MHKEREYGFGSFDITLGELGYYKGINRNNLESLSTDLKECFDFARNYDFTVFEKQIQTEAINGGGELLEGVVEDIENLSNFFPGKTRIHLPRGFGMGLSDPYKKSREGYVQNVIDLVSPLKNSDIDAYIIHPLAPADGNSEKWRDALVTSMRHLNLEVFGESGGVNFLIETNYTIPDSDINFCNTPEEVLEILKMVNEGVDPRRWVLLDIDISHTETLKPGSTKYFFEAIPAEYIGQVSLSDFKSVPSKPGIAHMTIGDGDIPWPDLVPHMIGLDVPFVIQVYPRFKVGRKHSTIEGIRKTFFKETKKSRDMIEKIFSDFQQAAEA